MVRLTRLLKISLAKLKHQALHGPMDKALVYGTRDSGFDPQWSRIFFLALSFYQFLPFLDVCRLQHCCCYPYSQVVPFTGIRNRKPVSVYRGSVLALSKFRTRLLVRCMSAVYAQILIPFQHRRRPLFTAAS